MTLCQSWQSSAQLCTNFARARQSSNAFKAKFFFIKVYLCKACFAKKGMQTWCYRPRLLAGAFGLVWGGTRRPHIGLGHHINFHSHFRPKMGIVKKYHEKSILVPKHISGVYKHRGTLKLCSESFYLYPLTRWFLLIHESKFSLMNERKPPCKRV